MAGLAEANVYPTVVAGKIIGLGLAHKKFYNIH